MTPQLNALLEQKMQEHLGAGGSGTGSSFLTLSDLEGIPDQELLEALADEGLPCTHDDFDELTSTCTSSDDVYDALVKRNGAQLIARTRTYAFWRSWSCASAGIPTG